MNKIMKEAADLLKEIIDFAETKDALNAEKIEKFTKEMIDISIQTYKQWSALVCFFKEFSPVLKSPAVLSENDSNDQGKEMKNVSS